MKKHLHQSILTVIGILQLVFAFGQGAHYATVTVYDVPARSELPTAITFDGAADEASYGGEQTSTYFFPTGQPAQDALTPGDFGATFKVFWDWSYFYIWVSVFDDTEDNVVANETGGYDAPWTFDNVELFFDMDTADENKDTGPDTNARQLRFNRGVDTATDGGNVSGGQWEHYYLENTSSGWSVEAAIPWETIVDGLLAEDVMDYLNAHHNNIGFDFSAADSDGDPAPGTRDIQTAWDEDGTIDDNQEDQAWHDTKAYGIINLAGLCEDCCWGDCIGIEEDKAAQNFGIIPNPATNEITFNNVEGVSTIEIMSMLGQSVLFVGEVAAPQSIDIAGLKSGLYVVKATLHDQSVQTIKLVIH